MSKYIDAERMMHEENVAYENAGVSDDFITTVVNRAVHRKIQMLLSDAPAEDVAPVRRGEWINPNPPYMSDGIMCDNCGYDSIASYNFCPNCGADMRKEKHEDN